MEGVLVSARRQGSTRTVTVVTNAEGVYSFPARTARTGPVRRLDSCGRVRAPGAVVRHQVDVADGRPARLDLNLRRGQHPGTRAPDDRSRMAGQLSARRQDEVRLLRDCSRCHTLQRAVDVDLQRRAAGVGDEADGLFRRQLADDVPAAGEPQTTNWGRAEWGEPTRTCTSARRRPWPRSI